MLGSVMGIISLGPDILRSDIGVGDANGMNSKLDVAIISYGKTQSIFHVIRESFAEIILHEVRRTFLVHYSTSVLPFEKTDDVICDVRSV